MIELKISNGEYLTHEDLEKYLKEYELFMEDSKTNLLTYELDEFRKTHRDIIEKQISQYDKIELIVDDIEEIHGSNPNFFQDLKSVRDPKIGGSMRGKYEVYTMYLMKFKKLSILIDKNLDSSFWRHNIPEITFTKLINKNYLPGNIKKGDKLLFNINLINGDRTSSYRIKHLDFYEQINLLHTIENTNTSTNKENTDTAYSKEKIYKGNDIKSLKIEFIKKLKTIYENKELYDFEKDPLIKILESEYIEECSKINKIEVRFKGINLTKIKFLEKQFIDKITGKQLDWKVTYNDEKENLDVYTIDWEYSDEGKKEFGDSRINNEVNFPSIRLTSYYSYKPTFKRGEVLIFNVKYVSGQQGKFGKYIRHGSAAGIANFIYFSNFIDEKFLLSKLLPDVVSDTKCFVVTATMGDINHPVVNDFRTYRDNVLNDNFLGRLFISIYYTIGPSLAKLIESNHFLLNISRKLVLYLHTKIK
jgi:hypothetical protein